MRTLPVNAGFVPASAGRTRASLLPVLLGLATVMSLTAAGGPAPSSTHQLHSGTEGTKAALVRIELSTVAEIVHIDHTTGEVEIARDGTTVPLGPATGVLVSADGIVATTWENLIVDEEKASVYAANELFADVIGVPIVGNGGDPAQRGSTPDPHWGPHLHHCYDQVTHCVHFRVPQYHVRTYTSEPGGVMAELLNAPSEPDDVALLRISGGGGAPTATIAAPDAAHGTDTLLLGFTRRPGPERAPAGLPVTLDAAPGQLNSSEDLAASFDEGVSGGPVVDRSTGQVIGLAGPLRDDGSSTLVPAADIRTAMEEADVEPTSSKFDVVFRRGIDHLSSGNPGKSAASALEESLTYYDSALATSHLQQAQATADEGSSDSGDPVTAAGAGEDTSGPLPGPFLPLVIGLLLVAGIIVAIVLGRGRTPATAGADARTTPGRQQRTTPRHSQPTDGPAPPASSFCSQCGRSVGSGARFCSGCGHPAG